MSRINTNVQSLIATRVYNSQYTAQNQALTRLSTGLRINTGKDDPPGLIASEALRATKTAIEAAQYNIVRAGNVVSVAESGLAEINRLLTDLEELVDKSSNEAGLTDAERNANQLEIDAILTSINRIAKTTEFQGKKLLGGALEYTTSGAVASSFATVSVLGAKLNPGSYQDVSVNVYASAQTARLVYSGATISQGVTVEIGGNIGTEALSFVSGTTIGSIRDAVNQNTVLTGVSAAVSGSSLVFNSTEYGAKQFVSVKAIEGTFAVSGGDAGSDKDFGRDVGVTINGINAVTDGLTARIQSSVLSIQIELTEDRATNVGSKLFQITGGGADFMITPTVSLAGMESLGIPSVSSSRLGRASLGFLNSLGTGQTNSVASRNFATAQRIVREAQTQTAELRGRLAAFQKNTLTTMANSLGIAFENTTAAESAIRDADFATETSNLTRSQILVQSASTALRLANVQPQSVLQLLGG